MEHRTVWFSLIVLLSFQRSTNSQTETVPPTTSMTEIVTGTEIITDLATSRPPTGTPPLATPPPPPPPTPPPPPPSTVIPPATTPPPTETMPPTSMPITRMPTTVAMPETTIITTPGPTDVPSMNPPTEEAQDIGQIGVILNVPYQEFDDANFRKVIAREVNNYCTEYLNTPQECAGAGQTVGPQHVIIFDRCDGECTPAEAGLARAQRKLLQTAVTQVNYYVANPTSSFEAMMTTEQQIVFLQDENVAATLEDEIGFSGIPSTYLPPPEEPLEGWEIALIVIGSVAFACLVAGFIIGFIYHRRKKNAKDEMDFELQNTKLEVDEEDTNRGNDYTTIGTTAVANGMNGNAPSKKKKAEEVDFSSQVKYKEIIEATGYKPVQEKLKEVQEKIEEARENGDVPKSKEAAGTSMVVTADIASSSSSSSSQNDVSEKAATAEEKQEIPPKYPSDDETRKAEEEAAAVVGELDNLVADQKKEDEKTAFENPAFDAVTDVDEDGIAKTSL